MYMLHDQLLTIHDHDSTLYLILVGLAHSLVALPNKFDIGIICDVIEWSNNVMWSLFSVYDQMS